MKIEMIDTDGDELVEIEIDEAGDLVLTQDSDIVLIDSDKIEEFVATLDVVTTGSVPPMSIAEETATTLRYEVRSNYGNGTFAAFRWLDRAEDYKDGHCATGYIMDTKTDVRVG